MFFLGIDAGGTKTQAILTNQDQSLSAEYITGSGNYKSVGVDQAIKNIKDAILGAIQNLEKQINQQIEIETCCIGISSLDTPFDREILNEAIQKIFKTIPINRCKLVNDVKIALRSGTQNKNAIVLIAGTGSHCYGTNDNAIETHVGGLDFVLSDEGSGFMIGSKALRAAVQSMDGRIEKTLLEPAITNFLKVQSMREAKDITTTSSFTKTKIAEIAKLVFQTAAQNDKISIQIIEETTEESIAMIKAAINKLDFKNDFDLVLIGGLFKEDLFKSKFLQLLASENIRANIIFPEKQPAWGAVSIAIEL